jgi:hypothetical protein
MATLLAKMCVLPPISELGEFAVKEIDLKESVYKVVLASRLRYPAGIASIMRQEFAARASRLADPYMKAYRGLLDTAIELGDMYLAGLENVLLLARMRDKRVLATVVQLTFNSLLCDSELILFPRGSKALGEFETYLFGRIELVLALQGPHSAPPVAKKRVIADAGSDDDEEIERVVKKAKDDKSAGSRTAPRSEVPDNGPWFYQGKEVPFKPYYSWLNPNVVMTADICPLHGEKHPRAGCVALERRPKKVLSKYESVGLCVPKIGQTQAASKAKRE